MRQPGPVSAQGHALKDLPLSEDQRNGPKYPSSELVEAGRGLPEQD